ncbi:MAG TPA: MFS transporter [Polyangia bacterium]|nr:MFS transporter [Polyangia bacterium]
MTSVASDDIQGNFGESSRQSPVASIDSRYAWVVLSAVFLAGIAATLSQYEVPPVLPVLMHSFGIDLAAAGWLMSIFAVTGAVVALPSGYILQRLGAKTAGIVAIGIVGVGGVVGALSGNFEMLLLSRALEGVGLGLIAVVAPTVIALWFPLESRGVPMGIWATWVPVGGVVMFNSAPTIAAGGGWQLVWWLGAAFCLISLVLFRVFVRMPASADVGTNARGLGQNDSSLRLAMGNRSIWLLALFFCLYCISQGALSSFYPTFLVSEHGYSLSAASTLSSLPMVAVLFSCPLAGLVSDRLGTRKLVYTIPTVLLAGSWLFPFVISGWQIPVFMVLIGLLGGAVATAVWAAVPEVMERPQLVGMGMAILMLGQSVGYVIGPAVFSRLVQIFGWAGAGFAWIPLGLVAASVGWFVKVR